MPSLCYVYTWIEARRDIYLIDVPSSFNFLINSVAFAMSHDDLDVVSEPLAFAEAVSFCVTIIAMTIMTPSMAAISHILETVASSMDMVSRVGRSVLICLSASTPAPAFAPRRSGQGSSVWRAHHEVRPLAYLRSLPPGCTTCRPG